jgi:hypothetical protein
VTGGSAAGWPIRGVVEGFYGTPWSHAERLDRVGFCGSRGLNTYVYAPKDDPLHRDRWREPYSGEQLEQFGELAEASRDAGVELVYALAPGLSICHSSDDDFRALVAKADQLRHAGVQAFHLLFDDIETDFHCDEDRERFASIAAAQAHVTNHFLAEAADGPLAMCPIEYAGTQTSPYRAALRQLLDPRVLVYWTGRDVVVSGITKAEAVEAAAAFGHELLVWDNYPVNDFDPTKLFLGPLRGRAADLAEAPVAGFLANPMVQCVPSKLALATVADYAGDPAGYDPERSFAAALREVGGEVIASL